MEAFFAKPSKPCGRDTRPRFPHDKHVTTIQDGVAKLADAARGALVWLQTIWDRRTSARRSSCYTG
jgi:hypothetical protein